MLVLISALLLALLPGPEPLPCEAFERIEVEALPELLTPDYLVGMLKRPAEPRRKYEATISYHDRLVALQDTMRIRGPQRTYSLRDELAVTTGVGAFTVVYDSTREVLEIPFEGSYNHLFDKTLQEYLGVDPYWAFEKRPLGGIRQYSAFTLKMDTQGLKVPAKIKMAPIDRLDAYALLTTNLIQDECNITVPLARGIAREAVMTFGSGDDTFQLLNFEKLALAFGAVLQRPFLVRDSWIIRSDEETPIHILNYLIAELRHVYVYEKDTRRVLAAFRVKS